MQETSALLNFQPQISGSVSTATVKAGTELVELLYILPSPLLSLTMHEPTLRLALALENGNEAQDSPPIKALGSTQPAGRPGEVMTLSGASLAVRGALTADQWGWTVRPEKP